MAMVALPKAQVGANPGTTEWTPVTTPSEKNNTIVPDSDIYDFAVGPDGETIYAVGQVPARTVAGVANVEIAFWKSTDGGATWSDKTAKLLSDEFRTLTHVSVAPDNADFVTVSGVLTDNTLVVAGSDNGGTKFHCTGDLTTTPTSPILCMDVSPEANDAYTIAVGTMGGAVYRREYGGGWGADWVDASAYGGWETGTSGPVTSLVFSPNWSSDRTVVVISDDGADTYLQIGKWATQKGWNADIGG